MNLKITHETQYRYATPVPLSVNQLCITPRTTTQQTCLSSNLEISPTPDRISSNEDCFGNTIHYISLEKHHKKSTITVSSIVQVFETAKPPNDSPPVHELRALMANQTQEDRLLAHDCLLSSPFVAVSPIVDEIASTLETFKTSTLAFAEALMNFIYREFKYDPNFSTIVTPMAEVIEARKGVCQDFAHLAIAVLRRVGIPARYVSGYLETFPPPGQEKLQGSDASHAWFSVFIPDVGWFDFDPTNNKRPDQQYVTTAWGRDYSDVAPIRGVVYGGGSHKLSVAVDVERLQDGLIPVNV